MFVILGNIDEKNESTNHQVGHWGGIHNSAWFPESTHETAEEAAERAHYLNGGAEVATHRISEETIEIREQLTHLASQAEEICKVLYMICEVILAISRKIPND